MIRPEHFGFNPQTAESNAFQPDSKEGIKSDIRTRAIAQFDAFVEKLRAHGIEVLVYHSPKHKKLPDAVFPNNWVTFHEDGSVVLYPMLAENRRLERRMDVIDKIGETFLIKDLIDFSPEEMNGLILEGSGSIVFDHINRVAYANASPRTDAELFHHVCKRLRYEEVFFSAFDDNGIDIFHTNVMMMISEGYCVICKDSISEEDRSRVMEMLQVNGLKVIEITMKQMSAFAGNMIQLQNAEGVKYLVMSDTAYNSLTEEQKDLLKSFNDIIHSDVSMIEKVGGGSARCMIAGIHLPKREVS